MLRPAPPRGRYDRALPTAARHAQQRERLLQATIASLAEHGEQLNVTHVVAAARVGRNTFYEHFHDVHDAARQATGRHVSNLRARLTRSVADAWTPRERLRSAIGEWLAFVSDEPTIARALLRHPPRTPHLPLSCAAEPLEELLRQLLAEARRDAVISAAPDDLRLVAVTAAVEAIARCRLDKPWSKADDAAIAVNVVLRAFR